MFLVQVGDASWLLEKGLSSIIVVVVALVTYVSLSRVLRLAVKNGSLPLTAARTFRRTLKLLMFVLVLLFIFDELGLLKNVWAAVLGVMGLIAVGFVAVWSILSNLLSTLIILILKPFHIGEKIALPTDELQGEVIDINFIYTTLRDDDGSLVQITNNQFLQKPIRRFPGEEKLTLEEQLHKSEPTEFT